MSYLDATGAARPRDSALAGLHRGADSLWADPLRSHSDGRRASRSLQAARSVVADAVGARPDDVIFTSSHTQAVHLAIRAVVAARKRRHGARIIAGSAERSSLLHAASYAGELTRIPVDRWGRVDAEAFEASIAQEPPSLAILQHANVEVGTLQPVEQVHAEATRFGVPLLVDAGASLGHVPVSPAWDLLALDAGEWGAPVRIGAVVSRSRVRMRPDWPEDVNAWFPGGVGAPAVFAAAVALEESLSVQAAEATRLRELTDQIRADAAKLPAVRVLGADDARLPHVVSLAIDQVDGEAVAAELDRRGISVGTGSACTSSTIEPNHVLVAMGVPFDGHLRVTLDHRSTGAEVTEFLVQLPKALDAVTRGE